MFLVVAVAAAIFLVLLCVLTAVCASSRQLLKQNIADHKPILDRLNKTGSALLHLVTEGDDAERLRSLIDDDNARFDAVKNSARERANALDEALQQAAEVRPHIRTHTHHTLTHAHTRTHTHSTHTHTHSQHTHTHSTHTLTAHTQAHNTHTHTHTNLSCAHVDMPKQ